jgi:hypothetical protein
MLYIYAIRCVQVDTALPGFCHQSNLQAAFTVRHNYIEIAGFVNIADADIILFTHCRLSNTAKKYSARASEAKLPNPSC